MCVCADMMMPSPAIVSVLQVTRSLTPTAALCGKSLADPLQEENWQDAQRDDRCDGRMKRGGATEGQKKFGRQETEGRQVFH